MPDLERNPSSRRVGAAIVVLFVGLVIAPLLAVAIASTFLFPPGGRTLEIEMRASAGQYAQVFWSSDYSMSQDRSSLAPLHPQTHAFETLRFQLPPDPLEIVRFDPMETPGEVVIRAIRVVDAEGRTVRSLDPSLLMPLNQIAAIRHDNDGARIITTPDANDAMLTARSSWFSAPPRWSSLQFVTPISLAWIVGAVCVLVITAIGFIVPEIRSGPFTRHDALWLVALFLVIIAAKLALIRNYPVPVPFWDQWDGEALTLYIPWAHDGLTWRQMFAFHNEHRIFFSRLLALSLLLVNGQWDPHLQVVVNGLLHAFIGVLVASILWLAMGRRCLPGIAIAIGLAFAPPFALENSLGGFQSAFYFLLLFSMLALWLMGTQRAGSAAWWLGVFCAACTPFTVAGGILVLAPIGVLVLLRAIATRSGWSQLAINVAALIALAAVGYAALPPPIAAHESLKAASFFYFRVAFARSVAFPFINYPRAAAFMWLPMAVLGLAILRRKLKTTAIEQLSIAIAVWVVVQCLAMAYSRGAAGAAPASRYLDLVAFGMIANLVVCLPAFVSGSTRSRALAGGALLVWLGITSIGIVRVSDEMLESNARVRRQWSEQHVKNVRRFVITDDFDTFLKKKGPQDLPYHSPTLLAAWLEDPYIRHVLPAAVAHPLELPSPSVSSVPLPATIDANDDLAPLLDTYAIGRFKGVGTFQSQPQTCHQFRHLRFEVSSSASWDGLQLLMHDLGANRDIALGMPVDRSAGWNDVIVRCPSGPFTIAISDNSPTAWISVRPPAEIAWASTIAASMIQDARWIGFLAFFTCGAAVASSVNRLRGTQRESQLQPS
jgi:hypothetical protein